MIKAIIFDLDGTLINSLDDLADSVNYTLLSFGFPTHETEKYKYFIGHGMANLIHRALPENHRDEETHKKVLTAFLQYYKEHSTDKTAPYKDIKELLDILKNSGIKTAVVTNKVHTEAEKIVHRLLGSSIDLCIGQQPNIPTKPDPTLTLITLQKLGVTPDECLFIGDSGSDMLTAVNSGIIPVGVLWGFREKEELLQYGAEYLISEPMELLGRLKNSCIK